MAECFHCGAGNPVGVCHRCNALVCPVDGTRPRQFKCVSCGSAAAAASAVKGSGQSGLNSLSTAVLESADADDGTDVTWQQLLAGGLRLRRDPDDREGAGPGEIETWMSGFRSEVDAGMGVDEEARGAVLQGRLPGFALSAAGASSGLNAVLQAHELWEHLDRDHRNTLALALLMHVRSRPEAWTPALGVLLYGLHPEPASLPQPWE